METKYLDLDVKTDGTEGSWSGRASVTGIEDLQGDTIDRGAFAKTIRDHGGTIKVLVQHDVGNVIGKATVTERHDGLHVHGQLELKLQSARDLYLRLRKGLISGLSIGYEVVKDSFVRGHRHIQEVRLFEVSFVTFPAMPLARVTAVKRRGTDDPTRVLSAITSSMRATRRELQRRGS